MPDKARGTALPVPQLKLKVKLQCQLNLAGIAGTSRVISENRGKCVGHLAKRTRRGNIRIGITEVGMVERIEEFSPELQLISFRELELLEQTQVPHLNARAVEYPGSTIPELAWSGL
jgi:hypothetical protein